MTLPLETVRVMKLHFFFHSKTFPISGRKCPSDSTLTTVTPRSQTLLISTTAFNVIHPCLFVEAPIFAKFRISRYVICLPLAHRHTLAEPGAELGRLRRSP